MGFRGDAMRRISFPRVVELVLRREYGQLKSQIHWFLTGLDFKLKYKNIGILVNLGGHPTAHYCRGGAIIIWVPRSDFTGACYQKSILRPTFFQTAIATQLHG
eukprot:sb/3478253/